MAGEVVFNSSSPLDNQTVGDIFITLDSTDPIISRLRIPDHDALATATVICNTENETKNATYTRSSYSTYVR